MKPLIFATIMLSTLGHAEMIKCPERFPAQDVSLPTAPSGEEGGARVQPARLSGAYFEIGPLFAPPTVPLITKVKGGWDTEYLLGPIDNHEPRWLVCRYGGQQWGGGQIERWEKLPKRFTRCLQKVRAARIPYTTNTDWTQSAVCE